MPERASGSAASVFVALVIAIVVAACGPRPPTVAPSLSIATPPLASLTMDATGLGPCTQQWYTTCNYGIRIEGAGGYDHRGNFAWDEGRPAGQQLDHGPAANVASTGIYGDVPASLGSGVWTISFRLWYGSDAIQYAPVPSGTPRLTEEDPFNAACSTQIDTAGLVGVTLHVAFSGPNCTVVTQLSRG